MYQRQQQEMIQKFEEGMGMYEDYPYSDEMEDESSNESQQNHPAEEGFADKQKRSSNNNKQLQDMLFRQLREISEEDTKKLFQDGGHFELNNDQHLIRMLKMLTQLRQRNQMEAQHAQA